MRIEYKIAKAIEECYIRMYAESEPSADWNLLKQSSEVRKQRWFMNYYLSQDRQDEIIEEVCKDHKLPKWMHKIVSNSVILGCSPTGVKK